jgi:hypothetical protein
VRVVEVQPAWVFVVDVILIFKRPCAPVPIKYPCKNRVRYVNFRPFNALHSASTDLSLSVSV